jgi:hypothetical protein
MKRTLTLITILTGLAVTGMAQGNNGNNNQTPAQLMDELRDCLDSKGVTYQLAPSMNSNQLYLIVAPGTPYGLMQSCLVQYNHEANSTPGAPILVRGEFFDF